MTPQRPDFAALRPALGARADALEAAWVTSPEDRDEIEIVTELLRRQMSRGARSAVLLQPPTANHADGPIRLGQIVHGDASLGWLGIHPRELCQHFGAFGRSGSGKSTLCLRVLVQLMAQKIPWLVFDYKRSARALKGMDLGEPVHVLALGRDVGATLAFNIMVPPPGVSVDSHQRQLAEMLATEWYAGDGVIALLERAMAQCYAATKPNYPTLLDVRQAIEDMPAKSREVLWRTSCQRILQQLCTGSLGRILCTRTDADSLLTLRHAHTVLEVDGLATNDVNFLTQHIMRFMTQVLLTEPGRESLKFVCLVEEAHHLLAKREGGKETVLETCLREGREVGLGVMLADQSAAAISPVALANCYTVAVMNCRQRADVSAAAGSLLLKEDDKELLGVLPVGEAVVRLSDRWPYPVHIRVPPLDLPKGTITDHDLRVAFLNGPYARMATSDSAGSTESAVDTNPPAPPTGITPLPRADKDTSTTDSTHRAQALAPSVAERSIPRTQSGLGLPTTEGADDVVSSQPAARLLLEHIAADPLLGVAARYTAAGLSRRKGDACKQFLIETGHARPVAIPTPEGKTILLELTDAGRTWLARHRMPVRPVQGSLLHAYWQKRVATALEHAGWSVELESKLGSHLFDLRATKGDRSVLLEVETGRSDWLANLSHLEGARATHRAVLWLDPAAILRVRRMAPQTVTVLQPAELRKWVLGLQ